MLQPYTIAPELVTSHWLSTPAPISLRDLRGKVVVIEAFQMLCPGCVSHGLPQAMRIAQTFSDKDVAVLGLHTVFEHHEAQGTRQALEAFVHEYRITFPIGIDAQSLNDRLPQTMSTYGLRGTPSLILIDRLGRYREQFFGNVADLLLGAKIMALVQEHDTGARLQDDDDPGAAGCDDTRCSVD